MKIFNNVKPGDKVFFVRNYDTLDIKPEEYIVDSVTMDDDIVTTKCRGEYGVGITLNVESFCSAIKTSEGVYFLDEVMAYDKIAKRKKRKIEELKNELKLRQKSYDKDLEKIVELSLPNGKDLVHG